MRQSGQVCGLNARMRHGIPGAMRDKIYKIVNRAAWRAAEAKGQFDGAPVDLRDGFIHFSTAVQVRETARRHFAGVVDLLLVEVDADGLGEALRWEVSRGGDLFPHLYGSLLVDAVTRVLELPLGADGEHRFPAGIGSP
jgi:uncharacterized protein (DUF952 family)